MLKIPKISKNPENAWFCQEAPTTSPFVVLVLACDAAGVPVSIGDAHQPLHMCTFYSQQFPDGDLAGNRLFVEVDGREIKLHSLCDAAGGALFRKVSHPLLDFPNELDAFENQASKLQSTYTFSPAVSQDMSLSTWESEDLAFCAEKIYLQGTLLNNTILDDAYLSTLRTGLLGRVTLGGVRLAHFLIDLVASV